MPDEKDKSKKKKLTFRQNLQRISERSKQQNEDLKTKATKERFDRQQRDISNGRQGLSTMDTRDAKRNAYADNARDAKEANGGEPLDAVQQELVRQKTAVQNQNLDMRNYNDQLTNNGRGENAFSQGRAAANAPDSVKQSVRVAKSIRRDLRLARRNAIRMGDREAAANLSIQAAGMGLPLTGVQQAGSMHKQAVGSMQNKFVQQLQQFNNPLAGGNVFQKPKPFMDLDPFKKRGDDEGQ